MHFLALLPRGSKFGRCFIYTDNTFWLTYDSQISFLFKCVSSHCIGGTPLSCLIMPSHFVSFWSEVLLFKVKFYANKANPKSCLNVEDIKYRQTKYIKVGSKHPNSIFSQDQMPSLQSVASGPRGMWLKGWTALLALIATTVTANSSDDKEELTNLLTKLSGKVIIFNIINWYI